MANEVKSTLRDLLRSYWQLRGGTRDFFKDPWFILSLVLMPLTLHEWTQHGWWDRPISVLPNILGFSLGGYALLLSFGDDRFKRILAAEDPKSDNAPSLFMEVSSIFLHFILFQGLALLAALIAQGLGFALADVPYARSLLIRHPSIPVLLAIGRWAGWFVGYWLFLYSLVMALAAAVSVFELSKWFEDYQREYGKFLRKRAAQKQADEQSTEENRPPR